MNLTFSANIKGNFGKIAALGRVYDQVQDMSSFMFKNFDWSNKENNKYSKTIYSTLRNEFPEIHSKLVQKAMKEYGKFGKTKLAKKPINIPLIFDNQNFDVKFENGYYNLFVKLLRLRFPIEGLRTIEKIKNKKIQQISIKKFENSDNYRIYFVCEETSPHKRESGQILGLDLNVKSQVLSSGKFFHTKELAHRKDEYRKNKGKKNIDHFTKDYLHKVTNKIVKHLVSQDVKVLRLEKLTNLRKNKIKEYGKENRNYKIHNCFPYHMIRSFLEYKCQRVGIEVENVNPSHTSDTCYKCGSRDTIRFPREILSCYNSECLNVINSDLNGARNIAIGRPIAMGQRLTRPSCTVSDCFQDEILKTVTA